MKKKPTVTVGIPAYNEEVNIGYLLKSILKQKQDNFAMKEIIVISDGSTDGTVNEVREIKNKKIRLIAHKHRKGKVKRLNQMFAEFKGDVFVQFDADILLKDNKVLSNLIVPFIKDKEVDLVLGRHVPLSPNTFIERLAYFGVEIWEEAKTSLGDKAERYYCTGQIRAFSKDFLRKFRLPSGLPSAEDVYSYFFAKTNGFKVEVAKSPIVYFRLASSFGDYFKQMSRFLDSSSSMKEYFGEEAVSKYNLITNKVRLKALLRRIKKSNPFITICYLALQSFVRILSLFYKRTPIWNISSSTKITV